MSNTLLLKRSATANAVPLAANIALGELAINYTDGNLFYKNNAGTVTVIASNQFLSVAGNVTGGNVVTSGLISATGNISSAGNISANFYTGNGSLLTGVTATGIGTLTSLSVTGNINTGNLQTAGLLTATGNVTGGNVNTAGLITATGNITSAGNVAGNFILGNGYFLTGVITSVANINLGNSNVTVTAAGGNIAVSVGGVANTAVFANTSTNFNTLVSASGNVTGGNLITGGLVTATGNVTGGNINTAGKVVTSTVSSTGAVTVSTGSNGNINLQPNGTGNIVLNATYVNALADPVQAQDAATKIYVDNLVSTGLSYHPAVVAATTTTLATTTGGTISYTQPNGAGNGVGALLTTTGSFNLIDSANVQTIGTRILVKNEANAVYNGVYTWANATNIVRSVDTDTYGPSSTNDLSLNDYFFVSGGVVNEGSAWVVDSPTGTITFGTSNISFAQFSSSQVYEANTQAGLSLVGTTFSAKVDNTTTAFDGSGNISVKASAQLTTPNIGAATGTSLSATANVTGGNINTGGLVTATGNINGGNIISAAQSQAANLIITGAISTPSWTTTGVAIRTTASTYTDSSTLASGTATSNHINVLAAPTIAGANTGVTTTSAATMYIAGGPAAGTNMTITNSYALYVAAGNVLAVANISGGNLLTGGIVSSTGNIIGGNINTGGLVTATGNVAGGNINTGGLVSATGNITSTANVAGGNVNATTAMYVGGISVLTVNSTVDGGTY